MPRLGESRAALLDLLGIPPGPLPAPGGGPSPFEAIVGVALGLVAEPRTAASALEALREAGLIEPKALAEIDPLELDDVFRQARVRLASKPLAPLRKLAGWASSREFDAEAVAGLATEALRDEWRAIRGVGPATADALLLFALARPTFPVDRASYRIFARHGWLDPSADYDEARSTFESIALDDAEALARLSEGLVRVGRDFCKPSAPKCERCPLRPLLPESGAVGLEG